MLGILKKFDADFTEIWDLVNLGSLLTSGAEPGQETRLPPANDIKDYLKNMINFTVLDFTETDLIRFGTQSVRSFSLRLHQTHRLRFNSMFNLYFFFIMDDYLIHLRDSQRLSFLGSDLLITSGLLHICVQRD